MPKIRFLFSSVPVIGHLLPMLGVGKSLVERGHEVFFISGDGMRNLIESAGLRFIHVNSWKYQSAFDFFSSNIDALDEPTIMRKMIKILTSFDEVVMIFQSIQPDIAFVDSATYAPAAASRYLNIKWATSCVFPDWIPTMTTVPVEARLNSPTFGLEYSNTQVEQLCKDYNSRLASSFDGLINGFLSTLGVPARSPAVLYANLSEYLVITYTTRQWEHPRSDWPKQLAFVGPEIWTTGGNIPSNFPISLPYVYVTLGTFWNLKHNDIYASVIEALKPYDGYVVVTTGGAKIEKTQFSNCDKVLIFDFLPQQLIVPEADFIIHHGGFGTAMSVLLSAKLSLVIPLDRSDHEMAVKFKLRGVGDVIFSKAPDVESIRRKISGVTNNRKMRERVQYWSSVLRRSTPSKLTAELLIKLSA